MFAVISRAIQTFLKLTDTPSSYSGQSEKVVRVKSTEDGLEFADIAAHQIIDADGDSYESVEKTADADEAVTYLQNVLVRKFHTSGILDLPKQSKVRAYLGSNQTVPTSTFTKILIDTENWDAQDEFDPTTNNRFTAKETGWYSAGGCVLYDPSTDGARYITLLYKNGASYANSNAVPGGTSANGAVLSDKVYLEAGDYLELYTYHTAGADQTANAGSNATWFFVHKLS